MPGRVGEDVHEELGPAPPRGRARAQSAGAGSSSCSAAELKGNSATLILRSPTCGEAGVLHNWGAEVLSQYSHRYFAMDPCAAAGERGHHAARLRAAPRTSGDFPFYTDYLVHWDSIYHLASSVREEVATTRGCAWSRPRRAGNFSAANREVVARLVPRFDNAIRTRAALDAARTGRAAYAEAMDHLTLATLILDGYGSRDHLRQCDGARAAREPGSHHARRATA